MLSKALTLITNPIVKWPAIVMVIWLFVTWVIGLVEDRALAEARVEDLERDLALQSRVNRVVQDAQTQAQETSVDLQRQVDRLKAILREVQNAPDSKDAPIAPVLRDTLDRLSVEQ